MDHLDDSENNAKVSDSAYSNSCSNSQSRRSNSSKSTHSGSNCSGSSGYGGKPSISSSSNELSQQTNKEKGLKKKTQVKTLSADSVIEAECQPEEDMNNISLTEEVNTDVTMAPPPDRFETKNDGENMDISISDNDSVKDEGIVCNMMLTDDCNTYPISRPTLLNCEGFSCIISLQTGVVLYTTSSLTTTLGFPKDMWIGRSFIDFVHPKDRITFASQITNGLAVPKILSHTQEKVQTIENPDSTMVCRIRRYRGLSSSFGVKETAVLYMPFLLKFKFKNVCDDKGTVFYLVIQTIPFFSAFKIPNEVFTKVESFVMRHNSCGNLEYIDSESVSYLGYLPQDIARKDVLLLYHPGDLAYLLEMYESIVKEGYMPRSKPYRLMVHNGHYIRVETEWSAFINPWSRKLEFVTGKYYIIEGPANPDVFQSSQKVHKFTEKEKNQAKTYRDGIIRILTEVLTKPGEIAKQQTTKRCQDLTLFMEMLMEDQPKAAEELRVELQDAGHTLYEQDSVMLGGISPHHEYDSKSSVETPLSYNQLNYNDNLQRYFNSHKPNEFLDNNILTQRNLAELPKLHPPASLYQSPMVQNSGADSAPELTSSGESGGLVVFNENNLPMDLEDYQHLRLTESILTKHNAEMEKELTKIHREHRSVSKGEREKVSNEARQKKIEHLARCNATFQTITVASNTAATDNKAHNLKRLSKQTDSEVVASKHHCPSSRQPRRRPSATNLVPEQTSPTVTSTVGPQWPANTTNSVNPFILGVGVTPQVPIMNPVSVISGMLPMYYTQGTPSPITSAEVSPTVPPVHQNNNQTQFQQPLAPCVMYGQPMYGSPIMYSPLGPQSPCYQPSVMAQNMHYHNALTPFCLPNSNYEEAVRLGLLARTLPSARRDKKRAAKLVKRMKEKELANVDVHNTSPNPGPISQTSQNEDMQESSEVRSASNNLSPKTSAPESMASEEIKPTEELRKNTDKTDGESTYSSFYSSFYKTESGSAEDSRDVKKEGNVNNNDQKEEESNTYVAPDLKNTPRRKMEPPWTEQVCVTSELIYKYQITQKPMEEVLSADKEKMSSFEQPKLVNEQLGQLYLDLQLEGVAARLTLEEPVTSSSSSGEEIASTSKVANNKPEYSQLVMIYEENAPLPSPSGTANSVSENNTSENIAPV